MHYKRHAHRSERKRAQRFADGGGLKANVQAIKLPATSTFGGDDKMPVYRDDDKQTLYHTPAGGFILNKKPTK
jgi:hypothetical protein